MTPPVDVQARVSSDSVEGRPGHREPPAHGSEGRIGLRLHL